MDLFSFTTIILMLFIIIGAYLIITNQIEGKLKIIIIVAVLVSVIYILINLNIFKSKTPKTSPIDASVIINVPEINKDLPLIDTTTTTFSLSTWIYISDWKSGSDKKVFSMTNDISDYTPKILLDSYKNELIITYYTRPIPILVENSNLTNEINVQNALQRYKDAKEEYILASNSEQNKVDGDKSSKALRTALALSELIISRKAYDGGSTGQYTNSYNIFKNKHQTLYVPSSQSQSAMIGEFASNTNSKYSTKNINVARVNSTTSLYTDIRNPDVILPNNYQTLMYNTMYDYDDYNNIANGIIYNKNKGTIYYTKNIINNYPKYNNSALYNYVKGKETPKVIDESSEQYSINTIKINQIRIQKWMNIVISFGDNSVDVYLDGKLVDSNVNIGSTQYVTTQQDNTILNWGGFTGLISSYNYIPNQLSPQDVWKIYKKGF